LIHKTHNITNLEEIYIVFLSREVFKVEEKHLSANFWNFYFNASLKF